SRHPCWRRCCRTCKLIAKMPRTGRRLTWASLRRCCDIGVSCNLCVPFAPARLPVMSTPLKIDFVSDVSCPWCIIGLRGLTAALDQLGAEVQAEIHFQPFE